MILIVTNREDITADFVVLELKKRKKIFLRFNTEDFPEKVKVDISFCKGKLSGGFKHIDSKSFISFSSIKSVWYRRPVLPIFANIPKHHEKFCMRESLATLSGIWDSLDCFWVSSPRNIYFAENKLAQLRLASEMGLLIPQTVVSNNYDDVQRLSKRCKGDIIIKPVKAGLLDDKFVVFTNKVRNQDFDYLKQSFPLPSIYQENIPKELDIRITVIGRQVFATAIHSQINKDSVIDWRRAQDVNLPHYTHTLPEDIKNKCLEIVEKFGLKFGAIDMILGKNGKYYFLEINPNGQWAWIEKRTGYKLTKVLTDMLIKRRV